jgi:omega-6 fatty acid desaturase (delta-12 desaturase)
MIMNQKTTKIRIRGRKLNSELAPPSPAFGEDMANRIVGFFTTLLPFLPSYHWSHEHARHHAAAGDLDRRGHGDIWTVTVEEYVAMPRLKQIWYRIYRNPVTLLGVGPLYVFLLHYRIWHSGANSRVRMSTLQTNLAIAIIITVAS